MRWTRMILSLSLSLTLVGCGTSSGYLVGDHLYIPKGYGSKLASMGLKEVQGFPQFTYPYISVAQNPSGHEYAVEFWSDDKVVEKSLPLTVKQIERRFRSFGVKNPAEAHLTIFEADNSLVWSCLIGRTQTGDITLYLDVNGNRVKDPWKKATETKD